MLEARSIPRNKTALPSLAVKWRAVEPQPRAIRGNPSEVPA
jgi:hypothetical protein